MAQFIAADAGRLCKVCSRALKPTPSYKPQQPTTQSNNGKLPTIPQICEACRKFYVRHLKTSEDLMCICDEEDEDNFEKKVFEARGDCRHCRFERCKIVLAASEQQRPRTKSSSSSSTLAAAVTAPKPTPMQTSTNTSVQSSTRVDFSKIPCKVCGCSSSGIHFGVVSCEGCKGFFRRSMRGNFRLQYRCKKQIKDDDPNSSLILCPPASNCRQCRLKRCIAAGMSESDSAIGRLNRQTRKEIDETIVKLSLEKSILIEPVLRRSKRATSDTQDLISNVQQTSNDSQGNEAVVFSSASSSGHSSAGEEIEMAQRVAGLDSSSSSSGNSSTDDFGNLSSIKQECCSLANIGSCPNTNNSDPSSSGISSCESNKLMEADNLLLDGFEELDDVINLDNFSSEIVSDANEMALVGYETIPVGIMAPEDFNSLELALSPSPYYEVFGGNELDMSRWLMDRTVDAAVKLTPISQVKIVYSADGPVSKREFMIQRSQALDTYIRAVSDFFTNLPGTNQVNIQDRVTLFANGFFPVLVAQLSLQFDADNQIPNSMSLDRNGAWQVAAACNSWQFLLDRYLCECGNKLVKSVFNLKEFALLASLLAFNTESPYLSDRSRLEAIRSRYELAVSHHMQENGASQERIQEFFDLVHHFGRATHVFQCDIRGLPVHCPHFLEISSPLFKDFRVNFVRLTPPVPCNGYHQAEHRHDFHHQ